MKTAGCAPLNSEEFDAFTREITSNMSRRKVLVYLGRVLVAALGVRWIFGLGRLKVGAQHHCFPVMDNGARVKGMYKRRKPDSSLRIMAVEVKASPTKLSQTVFLQPTSPLLATNMICAIPTAIAPKKSATASFYRRSRGGMPTNVFIGMGGISRELARSQHGDIIKP